MQAEGWLMSRMRTLVDEILRPLRLLLGIGPPPPPLVSINKRKASSLFVVVRIPGHIEPIERGERFEDPLQAALEAAGLGEVTGGGSQLSEPDEEGRRRIEFCEIEVDVWKPIEGLALLRQELARRQVPRGTVLQYELNGEKCEQPIYEARSNGS